MSKLGRIHPTETLTNSSAVSSLPTATTLQTSKSIPTNKLSSHKGLIGLNKVEPLENRCTDLDITNVSDKSQAKNQPAKQSAVSSQQQKLHAHRNPPTKTERLLDAVYFVCPDCSVTQCSTIILGLLLSACLTVLFLYLGGFWDATVSGID